MTLVARAFPVAREGTVQGRAVPCRRGSPVKPALLALILVASTALTLVSLPPASAHVCNGTQKQCGNCEEGEDHVHGQDESDVGCVSDQTQLLDNGYNKKGLPFLTPVALVGVTLLAALLARRR